MKTIYALLSMSALTLNTVHGIEIVQNCDDYKFQGVILKADSRMRGEEVELPAGQQTAKGYRVQLTNAKEEIPENINTEELLWHPDKTPLNQRVTFGTQICFNSIVGDGFIGRAALVAKGVPSLQELAAKKVNEVATKEEIQENFTEDAQKSLGLTGK